MIWRTTLGRTVVVALVPCFAFAISASVIGAESAEAPGGDEAANLFKEGLTRSNELRGTMLTEPASAEPCDSGVGEYTTSIRERLLIEIMSDCTARFVFRFAVAWATLKPSTVTGT